MLLGSALLKGREGNRTLARTEGEVGLWYCHNRGSCRPTGELQGLLGVRGLGLHILTPNQSRVVGCSGREGSMILGLSQLPRGLTAEGPLAAGGIDPSWEGSDHSTHPS